MIMAFQCFFLLLPYNSIIAVNTKTFGEWGYGSLGYYSLAIIYITQCFSSFFAPSIVHKMDIQKALMSSALTIPFWILAHYVITWGLHHDIVVPLVIIVAVIVGAGNAVFWYALFKYINDSLKICYTKAPLYMSIFWMIIMGSTMFSYFVNSFLFWQSSLRIMLIGASVMSLLAALSFLLTPDPNLPFG